MEKKKRIGRNAEEQALFDYQDAGQEFIDGGAAKYSQGQSLNWEDLDPETLAMLERSELGDISVDPQYKNAELDALRSLEEQSKTGLTARDEADMAKLQGDVNRTNRGRIGAIQQNMAARGMGGSGLEMVAQMQAAQDAADREAMAALEQGAVAGERRNQAVNQRAALAGQMGDREYNQQANAANANDAIKRFNVTNSNNALMQNNQGHNTANTQNWQRGNQTSDNNTAAGYNHRQATMGVQQGNAQQANAYATEMYNRDQAKKAQKAAKSKGQMGAVLGAAGAVAGGVMGSAVPVVGTAAGAMIGSQLGSSVGQAFAYGGTVKGPEIVPGSHPANDVIPSLLSAGEKVLPKEIANDPQAAAQFVAQENKKSGMDPRILDYLAKSNPDLVAQYRSKIGSAEQGKADAAQMQMVGGLGNVAGKLANDFANSQRVDAVYHNDWMKGTGPMKIDRAERPEYDGSGIDKLTSQGMSAADAKLNAIKEQMKQDVTLQRGLDQDAIESERFELGRQDKAASEANEQKRWEAEQAGKSEAQKQQSKIEWAKIQALKDSAAQKAAVNGVMENDPLGHIPKELRDNYVAERGKFDTYKTAVEQVRPIIEKLAATKGDAAIPFTAESRQYESDKANAAVAIMGKVDGIRSDADFKNLIEPLLPTPTDSPAVAAQKAKQAMALIESFAPAQTLEKTYPNPKAPKQEPKKSGASSGWSDDDEAELQQLEKLYGK